jgi:biopolymer transport protein ExbD
VNKKVTVYHRLMDGAALLLGSSLLSLILGLSAAAYAQTNKTQQTNQSRTKVYVQNTKQIGFKDKSAGSGSKTNSMSLNPSLFQKKNPSELMLDSDANLDYRVMQGCL